MITSRWRAPVAQLLVGGCLCTCAYLLVGCVGDLVELTEPDLSASMVDMASSEGGVGPHFFPDIQNDLNAKFCGTAGCHGPNSNMPVFVNKPTTPADEDTNYTNFKMRALDLGGSTDTAMSALLILMLPGGGHAGGSLLSSTTDPVYARWKAWIAAGGPR